MTTINPIEFFAQEASVFEVVLEGGREVREVLAVVDNFSEKTNEANVRLYLLRGGNQEVVAEYLDRSEGRWELSPIAQWRA